MCRSTGTAGHCIRNDRHLERSSCARFASRGCRRGLKTTGYQVLQRLSRRFSVDSVKVFRLWLQSQPALTLLSMSIDAACQFERQSALTTLGPVRRRLGSYHKCHASNDSSRQTQIPTSQEHRSSLKLEEDRALGFTIGTCQ